MEEMKKGNMSSRCDCGSCGGDKCCGGAWGYPHHCLYHILRWCVGILILALVFSFGVKIGELKSAVEGGLYGRHMIRGGLYGGGMMDKNWSKESSSSVKLVRPATTTPTR